KCVGPEVRSNLFARISSAMARPVARPSRLLNAKCRPPTILDRPISAPAAEKLGKLRAGMPAVTAESLWKPTIGMLSLQKKPASTAAPAPANALCPDQYSGDVAAVPR